MRLLILEEGQHVHTIVQCIADVTVRLDDTESPPPRPGYVCRMGRIEKSRIKDDRLRVGEAIEIVHREIG